MFRNTPFAAIWLLALRAVAQTSTTCDPLREDCPADPALGTTYNQTFTSALQGLDNDYWNVTAGSGLIKMTDSGAEMSLHQKGDSVTAQTSFYIFWGEVEVVFQAAKGQGIISTINFLSDDLDEIDIEMQGANTSSVSTNWYGQGDRDQSNAVWYPVDDITNMHTYKVTWKQDQTQWSFDGKVVRTLPYAAPKQYPQTPSFIKMGVWAAGDSDEPGVVKWAGGPTDWSKGPFAMTVKSIKITDGSNNVTSFSYAPKSDGSYQSITGNAGKSTAATQMEKPPPESMTQRWHGLSSGAKIGIACGVIGAAVLAVLAFIIFFFHQRRSGRKQRRAEDAQWDRENSELMAYQMNMTKGGFSATSNRM